MSNESSHTGTPQGSPAPQVRPRNNRRKPKTKPQKPETNTPGESAPTTSTANSSKPKKNTQRPQRPKGDGPIAKPKTSKPGSKKAKDPRKDYTFQQIKKLIKEFKPVTINGIPIRTICKQVQEDNESTAIDTYLLNLVKNQPSQAIYLSFLIIPSDPDFPFDLDCLKVSLCVPPGYPHKAVLPSIYVLNDEIPRGFAANIESGFKNIASLAVNNTPLETFTDFDLQLVDGKGLLSQIMTLDKYLELFLKQEKKKTIKFVIGKSKSQSQSPSSSKQQSPAPIAKQPIAQSPSAPVQVIDDDKRDELIHQLTQKLKQDIKLFNKSKFATKFKVWLPVNDGEQVPSKWAERGKLELLVSVPVDYPNGKLSVSVPPRFLEDLGQGRREAGNLCKNFQVFDFEDKSIVSTLNYVANNLTAFCCGYQEFNEYTELAKKFRTLL